jgi:hypothetical protein
MYFRIPENKELSVIQRRILMTLRFLTVFFITFLLAGPLIQTIKKITQHPVLILAVDNSLSMKGLYNTDANQKELLSIKDFLNRELSKRFEVISYTFGDQTRRNHAEDFSEKRSDYSQMIQSVYNNHFNENVGALVIVGDGKFNQGENPQNVIKKVHFPVYTVATGDTAASKDIRIDEIRVNKTAFAGNMFPVEVDIRGTGFSNENLNFNITHEGNKVFVKQVHIDNEQFFTTLPLNLEATSKGLQYYTVTIDQLQGEQNKVNNSWKFAINILENKQRILILSQGTHPDAGALKDALEQQINYEVSLVTNEPYPSDISTFNLIVLNQFPTTSQSGSAIIEQSRKNKIPLLVIVGSQTFIPQFNLSGFGATITPRAGGFEEAQAVLNGNFATFTLSDALKENLTKYPPLKVPFATYSLDPGFQEVFFQKVKNILLPSPLFSLGYKNGQKTGIIFGEGLWRWRIYSYMFTSDHRIFDELIDKIVQYLALRDNEDNFIIDFKPVYNETETVSMTAEVYNDAYELISTPEVSIVLRDSTNKEFVYKFDAINHFYKLDAGVFPPGKYSFIASTTIGSKEYNETGTFVVMPVNLEYIDIQANHRIMHQLSWETNGRFFQTSEISQLVQVLNENTNIKPINYFQTILNEILNIKWVFFVMLILISAEWFLRKFWGIY